MSSPKALNDNNMQLPSLDELDPTDQADYGESPNGNAQEDDELSGGRGFFVALPPGDEPGPSSQSGNKPQESQQYIPPDVRHDQNSRSSLYDQLPNSICEHPTISTERDYSQQNVIGPTLPPGFLGSDANDVEDDANVDEDEDPEDPGDPEDPEERGSKPSLPRFPSSSHQEQQKFQDNRSPESIGPALPSSFTQAPSLPDEEFRSCGGPSSSAQIPPPEPDSVRSSGWQHSCANHKRPGQKTIIGPVFPPDVLPTVSTSNEQVTHGSRGEESEDEIYGPILPPEVFPGPSNRASSGIEMPIEGDEHSSQQDSDNVIGPLPPTQEQLDVAEKEYRARLEQFNLTGHLGVKSNLPKREEWMVELPKKLVNYGLGPRKFSSKSGNSDDDGQAKRMWTESPSERQRRLAAHGDNDEAGSSKMSTFEQKRNAEWDMAQQKKADELNKNRGASLLEIYQRKRKTDSEGLTEDKKIRQPFDRERDMEVRGLGKNVSASEIKERMGQLSSRFACSSSKKFL